MFPGRHKRERGSLYIQELTISCRRGDSFVICPTVSATPSRLPVFYTRVKWLLRSRSCLRNVFLNIFWKILLLFYSKMLFWLKFHFILEAFEMFLFIVLEIYNNKLLWSPFLNKRTQTWNLSDITKFAHTIFIPDFVRIVPHSFFIDRHTEPSVGCGFVRRSWTFNLYFCDITSPPPHHTRTQPKYVGVLG